ncbi:hypothetical protein INT44_006431 [Umbelopsis vinacea]|uniref:Uncharacterized protein n=1 Tax=Umbelopsis vinacea TaxID=44442 RepID=A0A8H7PU89_9FUNG|nr:hypothetical protein INT44_006431 [Umbelopsis vinacea]
MCYISEVTANQNNPRTTGLTIGVTKAIEKLEKYFSRTWNSSIMATAIALDPRSTFVFWENSNLQRRDIDASKETVRLYWQYFRTSVTPLPTDSAQKLFRQGIFQEDQFTDYITGKNIASNGRF